MLKTVVVVEDDPSVREILLRALASLQCQVNAFEDGSDALDFLATHAGNVKVLVTDLQLPGGVSGENLVHKFRLMNPEGAVLVISGEIAEEYKVPVLHKPFGISEFLNKVRSLL